MTVRFTPQGCKIDTMYIIQPNGDFREDIVLSVDPASSLALSVEERAGQSIAPRAGPRHGVRRECALPVTGLS